MAVDHSYHAHPESSTPHRREKRTRNWVSRQLSLPAVEAVELRALGEAFGQTLRERIAGRWVWYPAPSRGARCLDLVERLDVVGCAARARRRGPGRPPLPRCARVAWRVLRVSGPCALGAELVACDVCDEARPVWGRARTSPTWSTATACGVLS